MSRAEVVISDFGGVLTSPLIESFAAVQDRVGIPFEEVGRSIARIAEADGGLNPLYELERGRISEADFLERLADDLEAQLGHRPEMHRFSEVYFDALQPNEPMIDLMAELGRSGNRMALLTNNVREWEPLWRAMLPVDEIFELVVDSAFVGVRKPDREIYELTCERLEVAPGACVFVDDIEVNCATAAELGMTAVHYREPEQAMREIRQATGVAAGD